MSALTITKIIEADKIISEDDVLHGIEEGLKKEFNKVKIIKNEEGIPEFYCRVRTKFFNPIVSVKGPITIQTKENKAKIMIDGDTKTNVWFWITLVLGCFFPILWIMMFFMYSSQKKLSIQSFEKIFERMEFDLKDL